ncbi:MAG: S-layer homology domain-containing protein, partial [Anaerovorax sp.]
AEKPEADGFRISGDGIESGGKNFTKEGLQSLGEESRDYTYMSGKEAVKDQVKGVSLDRIISGAGIDMAYGYTVNLKTTDGFNGNYKYDGTNKIPTYEHITLGAIKNQNYFVAYEVSGAAISDKDKNNVEANFRIYRNYAATVSGTAIDGSTNWLNCAKNIEGIEIVDPIANQVIFTISAKDFQSPSTYNLSKAYTKKELLAMKATTKSYKYKNQEVSAKGVMLSQLVKDLGIENPNTTITITTTDNYQDTTHGSNLKEIPVGELASKDYLVAYEVDGKTIEDTDKTEAKNTAYVQIYRTMDAGDSGKSANRIKNVNGMKLNPAYNWQTYLKEPNKPAVNEIRNMVAAADGGIWMGTKNGIHYATSQGAITKSYTTANGLPVNWVYDVVPDSKGGLWATQGYDYGNLDNNKGIVYISNTGEITNHTTKNPDGKPPHNFVQALELDSSGNLWIGSFGGLTKFNPDTNTWNTYTKADGLPALSVNVLTKDSKGGLWIGCYPEHTDITTGPFSGGYAYMDPKGVLTKFDADTKGEGLNSGYLADYWVTSIAVGKNDEAWIVRSGAYPYLDNVGGRVDYVSPDKQTVKKYKGKELIPDIEKLKIVTEPATANYYPEIRTVAVDGKGGIWFGTDGIGTYYCSQGKKGDISVIDRFSNSTFDWPLPLMDNVYALTILPNGGVYTGGTGGAAWNVFENLNVENESGGGGKDPEKPEIPSQVDLLIDGDDVEAKVGLTMAEIKEMPSITETYDSLNNFGTRGSSTFTGVPLSDVLKKANLKSSAKSVRMIARDGYYRQFNLDSEALGVYSKDKDDNAMMLAWKEGSKELSGLKLVVGQPNTSYINKELWVDNIVNIRVGNKTVAPGSGTAGAGADKKEEVKSPAQAVINEAKDLVNRIEQMTDPKEIQSVIEEFIKKSEPVVKNEGNEQEKAAMKKAMVEMAQAGLNKIGTVTVSGHGITDENKKQSAVISADLMKDTLAKTEKALAEINRTLKENGIFTGKDSLEGMITLQLPKSTGEEVDVTLQADFLESMKSRGLDGIKIQSSAGGILFHLSTLGQEYKGEKIVLKIESVEKDGIHGGIHLPEGSRVVNIRLWVGNQLLTDFGGEKITLSIPFDLGAGKHAQNVAAYFIDNNGRKTKMAGAVYNEKTKTVDTPSSHLSQFAAVYEPLVFTDVKQGAWYYDAVYALANAGWINGKGNGIFAPNDSMTRAEFVQILYKKAGMPTTAATAQFQDVKAGAWYAEAVHWAVKNKVVTGAAGLFRPEENISRQDMAVVLDRFEKNVEKKTLQEKNKQVHFADETQISAYAKEAVSTMQKAGVIQGVGNNRFAPKNNATRG